MNLPTISIASAGYGSVMNCEKNFQFFAFSIALFDGGWSRAKMSAQLPAWTETSGLPTDSTGASSSLASAGDPDCSTARRSILSGPMSSTLLRRKSVVGACRCHASKTPRRSSRPFHCASSKLTCFSGCIR